LGEALPPGEAEHGFGLRSIEERFVCLGQTGIQQLGLIHSSKRIIIEKLRRTALSTEPPSSNNQYGMNGGN
jgi:hypothetical protein